LTLQNFICSKAVKFNRSEPGTLPSGFGYVFTD